MFLVVNCDRFIYNLSVFTLVACISVSDFQFRVDSDNTEIIQSTVTLQNKWLPVIRSKMRCVLSGLMYETASKRVYKSKRCVLFMTFRPSQRTLFMARRNWVLLALIINTREVPHWNGLWKLKLVLL